MPSTIGPTDIGNPASMPAIRAFPAPTGPASGTPPFIDASNYRKFYTISAELRETYDSNLNTTQNAQSSYDTSVSATIVGSYSQTSTSFSAGATAGLTQYMPSGGGGGNVSASTYFNAHLSHAFSDRFTLSAADGLGYSPEPNIFGNTGTPYRNGQSISNNFTTGLSSQWTPLFGTQTTYANTIVRYLNADNGSFPQSQNGSGNIASQGQDSLENIASQSFNFAVLPEISLNFGGFVDDITYDNSPRGYTSMTGFVGTQWQALKNISVGVNGGASYTLTSQSASGEGSGPRSLSPYASVSFSWQIGERSSLSANYSHEITPTDQTGTNGQESDRFSANFRYAILPQLSSHLQATYTYSTVSGNLISSNTLSSYSESVYGLDTGLSYEFHKYFSTSFDITVTGVSSQIAGRDYSRDQLSVGISGTY